MAVSGFEGFEKRLELHFSGDDPLGLRRLPLSALHHVLSSVQCTIVSAVSNRSFDSYILSESSLFVYPSKLVLKTCGTTRLLLAVPSLLPLASSSGLLLSFCRYSRGSFIFPDLQPFPHSLFPDEVSFLDRLLPPHLSRRKASVLESSSASHSWHVFTAASPRAPCPELFTVEVCMTDLDRGLARLFYRNGYPDVRRSGDEVGREMTAAAGIDGIIPSSMACGYAFEPCGYSMNGLDRGRYSTIHVTPEDGFSYASFECVDQRLAGVVDALAKAVRVFGPGTVSVSVCGGAEEEVMAAVASAVESTGMECGSRTAEEFPGAGTVTYQTFSARCT